jgi:peptidoglycan hydrolase CwlO-like protein
MPNEILIVGIVIAWITSLVSLFVSLRKLKFETKKTNAEAMNEDAGAASIYADITEKMGKQYQTMQANLQEEIRVKTEGFQKQINEMNAHIQSQDAIIREQGQKIKEYEKVISELRDWSGRLVSQVERMGGRPVPMIRPARGIE